MSNQVSIAVSTANNANNKANSAISQIDVLSDEISLKVSKGDIASSINQTAQSVKINASKINLNGYVTFTDMGDYVTEDDLGTYGTTTIHGDRIQTGTLSLKSLNSNDENPIIRLFDTGSGYCSIDATEKYEVGQGNAIRLKADSYNYIKVTRSSYREDGTYLGAHVSIFSSLYPEHEVMIFQGNAHWGKIWTTQGIISTHGDNVYYGSSGDTTDKRLLNSSNLSNSVTSTSSTVATSYAVKTAYDKAVSAYNLANGKANSSHSHSGETWGTLKMGNLYTNYLNYKDGSTMNWAIVSTAHLAPNATNVWLGSANHNRWGGCYLVQSPNVSSDARLKENIQYIDNNKTKSESGLSNEKFYDFIKNDFKLCGI
mgnify:CR=1 FL=1